MAQTLIFDSTGDTTTTTGTGTLTGTGTAPTGYQTPTSGGVADGNTTAIRVETTDGVTWEETYSVYTASGTTWSRGTLIGSSTGSRISFAAGTKNIYCIAPKALYSMGTMTTRGDLVTKSATTLARLALGTTGQVLSTDGTDPLWTTIIGGGVKAYSNTSVAGGNTVANTAAETAFTSSYTIPANTLAAGDVVRINLWGVYSTKLATTPTMTLKIKSGSTVLVNTGAITLVGNVSNLGWSLVADLSFFTIGGSGTCDAQASGDYESAVGTTISFNAPATATTTVDTTADQAITVTATWSAADLSNVIQLRQMNLLRLQAQGTGTPVSVANGGTGDTTLTAHGVLIGASTSPVAITSAGTSGQVLTSNGASADPTFQAASTPATVSYTVTKTNFGPSGGTSEADILSFTVPSNTWLDGEMIELEFVIEVLNNDANGTFTYKGYWDGNSATINSAATWGTSATIVRSQRMIRWIRSGTDVYIATGTTPGSNTAVSMLADFEFTAQATPGRGGGRLTSQAFNADKIAKVSIQLSQSGASTYFNILRASVKKTAVS